MKKETTGARRDVIVRHADGLHARPAELVARTAADFASTISLSREDLRVDAKSILDLLTLGAAQGTRLVVEAKGDDAEAAADTLAKLLESDFDPSAGSAS